MVTQRTFTVYTITSSVPGCDKIYVGSTGKPPSIRFSHHKCCVDRLRSPMYSHFAAIGKENMVLTVVEQGAFTTKKAMQRREQHWMDVYRDRNYQMFNKNNAVNLETPAQRYQRLKEALKAARNNTAAKARAHRYYLANRARIRARSHARYHRLVNSRIMI